MQIDCLINNQLSKPPLEYRGIEVQLNFEAQEVQTSITNQQFTFVNESAEKIKNAINSPLGIFWGLPLKFNAGGQTFFDGMIDLTNNLQVSCNEIKASIIERQKKDWLEEVADKFDFRYLADVRKTITQADYIKIPYVASEIPDYRSVAMLTITGFLIIVEIRRAIKDIAAAVAKLPTGLDTASGVIDLILNAVFLVFLVIALLKLLKDVFNELIQPIKYHTAMSVSKHFEKGCQYLGLNFSSSLFYKNVPTNNELPSGLWENLVIMPEKNEAGAVKASSEKKPGYYNGNFGDFLREMVRLFNAKITIIGNTLHFERKDYSSSVSEYKIPDVRSDFYGYNTEELKANYLLQFQVDNLDLNTVNRYEGTNAKIITSSINTSGAAGTELIKGLEEKQFGFALGRRKTDFTRVEQIARTILNIFNPILNMMLGSLKAALKLIKNAVKAVNKFINFLNGLGANLRTLRVPNTTITTPSATYIIDKRINTLSLSSDLTGVPKLILITGSGNNVLVSKDNEVALSAANIWNKYHYIESFVPSANNPNGNQYLIKTAENVPFCIEDYRKIRGMNNEKDGEAKIIAPSGNRAKLVSVLWNLWQNTANIVYMESKRYAFNLKQDIIINKGS
jgi:hypothetical protein